MIKAAKIDVGNFRLPQIQEMLTESACAEHVQVCAQHVQVGHTVWHVAPPCFERAGLSDGKKLAVYRNKKRKIKHTSLPLQSRQLSTICRRPPHSWLRARVV
jgi:hypothetical protein